MDTEAEIRSKVKPRRVQPAGLRYDLLEPLLRTFYRDLDPDRGTDLDLNRLGDRIIRAETDRVLRAVEGLARVLAVGVNAAWPALRIFHRVGEVTVVHPNAADIRLAEKIAREKWQAANVRFLEGRTTDLPLEEGSVDAVISDCALASWEDPGKIAGELARVLDEGGLLVAREANWAFELQGKPRVEHWSFKRYGGDIYFGYTKRTLDPPREVEYICLLNQDHLWVKNLRAVPRDVLRRLRPEDGPSLADLLVSAEYFEIRQMTAESLKELLTASGFEDVRVGPSELESAVEAHIAGIQDRFREKRREDLAEWMDASWQDLAGGRSPFLLATAVKR